MNRHQRKCFADWLREVAKKLEADEPLRKGTIRCLQIASTHVTLMNDEDDPEDGDYAAV